MSTAAFREGTLVEIERTPYTLLRKVDDSIWQLEEMRTKRIHEYDDLQLRGLYVAGQLIFSGRDRGAVAVAAAENTLLASDEEVEVAKIRRLYVKAVLTLSNTKVEFTPAIQEAWEALKAPSRPPHWTTVYRWKKRYLEAGENVFALANNTKRKGNRINRYPEETRVLVNRAIDDKYLRLERGTIQDTLDHALALVMAENRLRPQAAQLALPSRRQVTTLIEAIPAFDKYAARHGRTAAVKRFRSVQAHRTTAGPLERAEIDHTPLDLMVIDDETGLPLGRPYITACIDDFTRCVLGLYVSFEPPSHLTVSRCLKQAFMPKTDLRKQFPGIVNEWFAHGVMRELVVDNGTEFHSISLENACYTLGMEIHYSARKTPWFKGKIERFLGTLNRAIAHGTPGTTFSNIFEKEEYDPSKYAIVRYSVMKEIITTWVVDVYHQQAHRTLGVPPAAMWAKSISPEDIQVPEDPAMLDAILGRSEVRRLTHKGIELYGLLYNSLELKRLRIERGDTLDVEIRVDTSDLGKITVFAPDKRQMFTVAAVNAEYATGLSEWQHRVCKRFATRHMDEYSPAGWLEAKARIADLIDNELMHKKLKSRTRIARYQANKPAPAADSPIALEGTPSTLPDPANAQPLRALKTPRVAAPEVSPTSAEITPTEPSASPRRFKPVYRERIPSITGLNGEEV